MPPLLLASLITFLTDNSISVFILFFLKKLETGWLAKLLGIWVLSEGWQVECSMIVLQSWEYELVHSHQWTQRMVTYFQPQHSDPLLMRPHHIQHDVHYSRCCSQSRICKKKTHARIMQGKPEVFAQLLMRLDSSQCQIMCQLLVTWLTVVRLLSLRVCIFEGWKLTHKSEKAKSRLGVLKVEEQACRR